MLVRIGAEDPRQPELLAMLADSDRYYAALYPAESNHLLDASTLAGPEVTFLVARMLDRIAGFGAIVAFTRLLSAKRESAQKSMRSFR